MRTFGESSIGVTSWKFFFFSLASGIELHVIPRAEMYTVPLSTFSLSFTLCSYDDEIKQRCNISILQTVPFVLSNIRPLKESDLKTQHKFDENFDIKINFREGCLSSCHERGTEKILSLDEESNLRSSDSALRCSTTEPQRLYSEWSLLRSSYETRHAYCYYQQWR